LFHIIYLYKINLNISLFIWNTETNNSPNKPTITGLATGKAGNKYDYKINASDPDDDEVYYYIDWEDGSNSGWQGPYPENIEQTFQHIWQSRNTYTIKAKAKDISDAESDWATFEISIPKIKLINVMTRFFDNSKLYTIVTILLKLLKT